MNFKYVIRINTRNHKLFFTYDRGAGCMVLRGDVGRWLYQKMDFASTMSAIVVKNSWQGGRYFVESYQEVDKDGRRTGESSHAIGFADELDYKWFKSEWADLWRPTIEIVADESIYKRPGESHSPLKGELLKDLGNQQDWTLLVKGARPMLVFGCKGKAMLFKLKWVNAGD
jgi:hypothetical protein